MGLNDFQVVSKLGEGSYSSVWRVKRISDGQEYAMKKVKLTSLSDKEKQNSVNEVRILASINDSCIVSYKEAFLEENSTVLCIIMEYAAGGDLYNKICEHQKAHTSFSEEDIWNFAYQMIVGLKTLHEMKILHRDLKSANVFLSKDGNEAKLGDLNVSKVLKTNLVYTQTGTPYYASPEIWKDQPYDMKSDIWSLGCVIYEMVALKPPFRAKDMQGLFKKVQKGVFEKIPSQYSSDLSGLISLCLKVSPVMRPTCDQLLKHPIVQRNCKGLMRSRDLTSSQNLLLSTIRFPKNLRGLAQVLPKPNYGSEKSDNEEFDIKKLPRISGNEPSMYLSKGYGVISRSSVDEDKMSLRNDLSGESRNSNIIKLDPKPRRKKDKEKDIQCGSKASLESYDYPSIRGSRASEISTPKDNILLSEQVSSLKPVPYKPLSRKVSKDQQVRSDLQRMERIESYERKMRRFSNITTEARSKSIVAILQSEKSGDNLLANEISSALLLPSEKEKMLDGRDITPNKILVKQNDVVASYRNRSQVLDEKYSEKRLLDRVEEENSSSHLKSRPVLGGRQNVPNRLYNNKSSLDAMIRKSRESPYSRHHLDSLTHQSYVTDLKNSHSQAYDDREKKSRSRKADNSHSLKNVIENFLQQKESVENYVKKKPRYREEL